MPNLLLKFRHGLGDAVQFTSVLSHLQSHRRDWEIDVLSLIGKHSAFAGLCRRSLRLGQDPIDERSYDRVVDLSWDECHESFADSPSTKAELCLRRVLGVAPDPSLWRYRMTPSDGAGERAAAYLESIGAERQPGGRFRAAAIHYEGNTSATYKNLPHATARALCDDLLARGVVPIVLDWDRRSPLPDGRRIHCPDARHALWGGTGTGDAEAIAALISQCVVAVGIDSGPQKVAAATDTPTVAVWTGHHPLHYLCPTDHVVNLVPRDHERLIRGRRDIGRAFFERHYRFAPYTDLAESILGAAGAVLHRSPLPELAAIPIATA